MLSRSCVPRRAQGLSTRDSLSQAFARRRCRCLVRSVQLDTQRVPAVRGGNVHNLTEWLRDSGVPDLPVEIRSIDPGSGKPFDMLVARGPVTAGEIIIDVPENLVITLDRIFESEFVAELLANGKLSELACLTLYMMYEKKTGKQSFWAPYIQELDRQRGRGSQAVESPLLWSDTELEELLQGSPLLAAVQQRLAGIREEYEALDTVWFMASSLFNKYPFDIPTEAFTFERFKQAFAAVQASIVHLQGVPTGKRFSLVPLGPPLLSYSSTAKAMLVYNHERRSVQLTAERDYSPGQPLLAWCGPQPNSRLLLNYGLVDENNPYDKLQFTVTLPTSDPLFKLKRAALQPHSLVTQQTFDLGRNKPLPPALLPFMRLALASSKEEVQQVWFPTPAPPPTRGGPPHGPAPAASASPAPAPAVEQKAVAPEVGAQGLAPSTEAAIVGLLTGYLNKRLAAYRYPLARDLEVIQDAQASPRQRIAARLTKIEKTILQDSLEGLRSASGLELPAPEQAAAALASSVIKFT